MMLKILKFMILILLMLSILLVLLMRASATLKLSLNLSLLYSDYAEAQVSIKVMRKKKDPSAPKPPLNSYMEFAQVERPRILLQLPDIPNNEVNKEIGLRWKNLSKEEKEKFKLKYHENKEKYMEEMQTFEKNPVDQNIEKPSRKKRKKDPLAPKLPLSSFMEFGKQERVKVLSELGNISIGDVGRELGKRWRALSKEEKDVFEREAKENREKYEMEKKKYDEKQNSMKDDISSSSTQSLTISDHSHDQDCGSQQCEDGSDSHGPDSPQLGTEPPQLGPESPQPGPALQDHVRDPPDHSADPKDHGSDTILPPAIKLTDLGFAKQKKYPWHPALRIGVMAKGTRLKVQFFGTGQFGTVDKSKWLAFSEQVEDRIKTPNLMKAAAFKRGLEQMKSLRDKLKSGNGVSVTASGIEFIPQIGGRRFRSLNKDQLQKEEEENLRQMEKKMRQEEGSKTWKCRDCTWTGKYRHRAKLHARDCGQRKMIISKKSIKKKFECSNLKCELSFALRSQLLDHYRYVLSHFD